MKLTKESKAQYITKRLKEQYEKDVEFDSEELEDFEKHIGEKDIKYIIFEDYNFGDLHWRTYNYDITYAGIVEDYFSDCDVHHTELGDTGVIYDVEKDKFFKVTFEVKETIVEVKMEFKQSISEVFVGEVYERDELFAMCDWFSQEANVLFGSVCGGACFRAEPDDIEKDKWTIKDYWEVVE